MKKEELTELGLTEEQINGVQAIHGRDIETLKGTLAAAEQDRDTYKGQVTALTDQLNAANETIDKFGDVTPETVGALKDDVEKYKTAAETAQQKYDTEITQRDQTAWLDNQLDEYGVGSPYARKAIKSDVMSADSGLPWRNGMFMGFGDYMAQAKSQDPGLYQTAEEKAAATQQQQKEEHAPAFAGETGDDGKGGATAWTPPKIF